MKTPAEYQREYRARKAMAAKTAPESTAAFLERPFNEYLTDNDWSEVLTYLEWAGINPDHVPGFENDDDPEHDPETDGPYSGSIGRAERMVGLFLDAASQLASLINDYKKQELSRAEERLHERAENASPDERRAILSELVKLNRIAGELDKQVRWTVPQWKVKGA